MTDKTRGLLYASYGHANLAVLSSEKRAWLLSRVGIETTDAPVCCGRLVVREEMNFGWAAPIDERKVTP